MTEVAVVVIASEEDSNNDDHDCEIFDGQDFETNCRKLEVYCTSDARCTVDPLIRKSCG